MSQLAASEGQPGNWEEPDFFLRRLETVRFQEKGWQERYDGRLSRTDLWGRGGEIPLRYPTTLIRGGIRKSVVFSSNAALFIVLRHHYIFYPYKTGGGFVTCYLKQI